MSKRVLYLEKRETISQQHANPLVTCCNDLTQVLSLLMGGSSSFGDDNYVKSGKVRPEVMVMDSAFLQEADGFELLEIIRKYYTLRGVSIYLAADEGTKIDDAILHRYHLTGILYRPFDINSLTERNEFSS